MLRYMIRRILYAIPTLIGVSLLTFVLFYLSASPEQMARRNLSAKNPTQQQIKDWLHEHHYDQPKGRQFLEHMKSLFTFQFGRSDSTNEEIWKRIRQGAGPSLRLGSLIFTGGLIGSITFALWVAYFRGTYLDVWATFLCVLAMSVVYVVYIIAGQYLLGKVWMWFPLAGYRGGEAGWRFVLLPMVIGVIAGLGSSIRLYRTFILEEMGQDYVRTARAKGIPESAVLFRQVLKNAAIPILTTVVYAIPLLLMGSLLLESFFGIPGLGGMLVDAINSQDFAVVRAMVFLGAVLLIVGFILTDISYALVDPRVRLE